MNADKPLRLPLRVVFYREQGAWVAHCLEFDLVGDGATRDKALDNLTDAIKIQTAVPFENHNLPNLFSPADGKYFERYAAGNEIADGVLELAIVDRFRSATPMIEDIQAREYEESDSDLALA